MSVLNNGVRKKRGKDVRMVSTQQGTNNRENKL
jgi:hypothetical protein